MGVVKAAKMRKRHLPRKRRTPKGSRLWESGVTVGENTLTFNFTETMMSKWDNQNTSTGWEHVAENVHVVPINDLREHVIDGTTCWCKPRVDEEMDNLVIHNSMDERESYENGRKQH